MPQYRIEISPNNRAGCKDSACSKEKIKLQKGEIRFGTWVEIQDHGSWAWKHWGCVSGAQLLNLKEACDLGNDKFDFDVIDGYDELSDPEVQEKVRRCVKQGFIDPEDFKGDPEKNKPGEKGIHLTAKQKAAKEKAAAEAADDEEASEDAKPAKKTAKRGRKKVIDEDGDGDDDNDADNEPKAKRSKNAKAPAKAPAKPRQGAKIDKSTPAKSSRGRKTFVEDESAGEEAMPTSAKKTKTTPAKATRGKMAPVKDDSEDEEATPVSTGKPKPTPAKATRGKKAAVKTESEEEEEEEKASLPAKKSKAATKPTRAAGTKETGKASRKSTAKKAAEDDSADERPAPKTKGRRSSRVSKI